VTLFDGNLIYFLFSLYVGSEKCDAALNLLERKPSIELMLHLSYGMGPKCENSGI